MGTITALKKQKRNPNRVSVFIDGEFAFGLAAITAVNLRIGQTITAAEIETIQEADQLENAKQSAIRFLEYRPRSVDEVRRNLQGKGFADTHIELALARLQEVGLLDDVQFAKYWVEQRETFKPRSQLALRQELLQKGIDRTIIEEIISEVDEETAARRAAQKQRTRWQNLSEDQFQKKAIAYLQRRGFSYMISKEIAAEMWEEGSTERQN